MNTELKRVFEAAQGRYPNEGEYDAFLGYAEGVVERLEQIQTIARAEEVILDTAVEAVIEHHKRLNDMHGDEGQLKVRRDFLLTLRCASKSMLIGDPNYINDKMAQWLRTILSALCDTAEVHYGYTKLAEACREHLTEADAAAFLPHLMVVVDQFAEERRKAA